MQGDLEQLVLVPDPSAVAQQCSTTRLPCFDPFVEKKNEPQPVKLIINDNKGDENRVLRVPVDKKMEMVNKSVKKKRVYESPTITHEKKPQLSKKEKRFKENGLTIGR